MERQSLIGIARAFAGALIFALPMIMTMELWWLGSYIEPYKLALLLALSVPLLTVASWIAGFEPNRSWADSVVDAFVAIGIAAVMSATILLLFHVISNEMAAHEVVGRVVLQTFPAGLGAVLARSQLGQSSTRGVAGGRSYLVTLSVMAVGALFLGLNVAPTEEVELLSYKMGVSRMLTLIAFTLMLMHGFVYALSFRGAPEPVPGATFWTQFVRYTLVGYAIVLVISLYLLWTFGRTDSTGLSEVVNAAVVLAFPGGIGAAASRLIL
jgi:putative integral membrane protein (TIGR02587 family)